MKWTARKNIPSPALLFCSITFQLLFISHATAQDNYEIQVYGSKTVAKRSTMFELHSNFTFDGNKRLRNGVLPTNHILHETIEITHGFTDFFEVGFYLFNAIGNDKRTNYVGSHIRPRVMAPKEWNWPVGVSLSLEAGWQKSQYSEDDWTLEIRPIVDKQIGNFYLAFNPALDKAISGLSKNIGYVFSPNFKTTYNISKLIAFGFEYYGSLGPLNNFQPTQSQQHEFFLVLDLSGSTQWEFNCGYGLGLTPATDNGIFKIIVGYRFH